jgi:hypothetical protein
MKTPHHNLTPVKYCKFSTPICWQKSGDDRFDREMYTLIVVLYE